MREIALKSEVENLRRAMAVPMIESREADADAPRGDRSIIVAKYRKLNMNCVEKQDEQEKNRQKDIFT